MEEKSCSRCKESILIVMEGEGKTADIYNQSNCSLHGLGANERAKDCPDYEEMEFDANK